jgi:hypothetical protein
MRRQRRHLVADLDLDLYEYVIALPRERKRAVAIAISRLALDTNELSEALVDQVLAALESGVTLPPGIRGEVELRVEALDEEYLQFAEEVGDDESQQPEVWRRYRKARAMESLFNATDPGVGEAVLDTTYECMAAVDSDFAAVRRAAGLPGS